MHAAILHCGERTAYEYGQVQVQAGEEPLTRSCGAVQVQALRKSSMHPCLLVCSRANWSCSAVRRDKTTSNQCLHQYLYGCMAVWSINEIEAVWSRAEKSKSRLPRLTSPRRVQHSTATAQQIGSIEWINVYVAVAVTSNVAAAGTQTLGISREQVRVPAVGKHTPCPVCVAQCVPSAKQPPVPSAHSAAYCSAPDPTSK